MVAMVICPRSARGLREHAGGIVHAYILVDSQTGRLIEGYQPDRRAHPASLTKLMTLYLTFQRLESGKLTLGTALPVSRHAASQQPTKLWLRPGSTITVREAVLGITTRSANDAAVVLAEALGGTETGFTRLMNRKASLLGMSRTRFYNASGLPDSRQWTTARDMATLGMALIQTFPQYYHFFGVRAFRFHGTIVYGHNHLLDECEGVDGMKTGYINASGFNVVTSAVRNHRRLVGVVLGGSSARARDLQMAALMNRGFRLHSAPSLLAAHTEPTPLPAERVPAPAKLVKTAAATSVKTPPAPTRFYGVIEVGGEFKAQGAVRRVLHSARLSAPIALHAGHPLVVRVHHHRYRARISRLTRSQALMACSALERKKFTCRILSNIAPPDQEVASTSVSGSAESE
jgi:D-alanyl-D-alanine carboxypeptidase